MGWIAIIGFVIAVEVAVRFLTRKMEDKKKRERLLALIWVGFGVALLVIWLILR